MDGLIRFSLANPRAITVMTITMIIAGAAALAVIPSDILPIYRSPAVQVFTFYSGMSATNVEADISNRMERSTGQAAGTLRQDSRSIIGVSIVRNYYADSTDLSGALTQVNSLATASIPNLPPGTLPPVILPFDPTSSTPVGIVALNSRSQSEAALYDAGRFEIRNFIMASPGANAPVVYGGKLRTVLAMLDRQKLQARGLSPTDVMDALDRQNVFLPAGDAKFGGTDYALDSNSMYEIVDRMGDIPIRSNSHGVVFLRDVATPKDTSLIQTTIVRVDGRRQVYIPVYRQQGSSTLQVVETLKENLPDMQARMSTPDVELKLVMDQSVYVKSAIESLVEEGILGAVLCSLVILLFLGQWRMTVIAVLTIPIAVFGSIACLYMAGQSINVMTLAGLALAIGPLVDSAIICLENVHRHLGLGKTPKEAAFVGPSEVAMPELTASLCTLLVLAPLTMIPGLGSFLFRPMFLAVAFAMTIAYLLSRTFVPARAAAWLLGHGPEHHADHGHAPASQISTDQELQNDGGDDRKLESQVIDASVNPSISSAHQEEEAPIGFFAKLWGEWEKLIGAGIYLYVRMLEVALKVRYLIIFGAFGLLALTLIVLGPVLRREFFPEVDAGSFEMTVRLPSGTRIEVTEGYIEAIETYMKSKMDHDLELIIAELGLTADWSAAYTPNSGPMDAVVKVQLKHHRTRSAQEWVAFLRDRFQSDADFEKLLSEVYARKIRLKEIPSSVTPFNRLNIEFAFDAGGLIRAAMNEGKSTPLNVKVTGKKLEKTRAVAEGILAAVQKIKGVVDARIIQRLDYPLYMIEVDRAKAAALGLNQLEVMRNIVASLNSSVQFNKRNFWIDPVSHNQYYVGVSYPEADITDLETLLDIPITGPAQPKPVAIRTLATVKRATVPSEISHTNLQATIDLTMGVYGRDLGHVADEVRAAVATFGVERPDGAWTPYDPTKPDKTKLEGSKILLSGEYQKMQVTFLYQGLGMIAAILLIYFLLVGLFKSYLTPVVVLAAVPVGLIGVVGMLWITGTALNVQSLLGVIFMIGIVVSNTVLLTDFAMNLQKEQNVHADEAIRKAAVIRVRPVVMTALATFFALIPMSLGLARGSEANVPLGRAVLGGLIAGLLTTLFVVPCIYSLLVPAKLED